MRDRICNVLGAAAVCSCLITTSFAEDPKPAEATSPAIAEINKALAPLLPKIETNPAGELVIAAANADPAETAAPPDIADITGKMGVVVGDLAMKETGEPVQNKEKAVVQDLDMLIAALKKEQNRRKGNMSNNEPKMPATESTIRRGTGGIGDLTDPNQSQKDWAKLSTRERDRILQSMSEGFPPEYRQVLERYYRRLAEEKTIKPSDMVEPKTAKPTNP
jgi:hypothetical protein